MIINEKEKFVMDYYPINKNILNDLQVPDELCKNILHNINDHPKELNYLYDLNKWDEYKDNILKQLVLFYNFDFKKISNIFDKICKIKREVNTDGEEIPVYTEKMLRYHWSFLHARRYLGKNTGEEFYILNKDENNTKHIEEDKLKENANKDISGDKNLVNTINVSSLNKERDLNSYFDKLLNQEMDKEKTKILEMELKEKKDKNNSFPINIQLNKEEKKVNEIIKDIKEKQNELEDMKKKLKKEEEEEDKENQY